MLNYSLMDESSNDAFTEERNLCLNFVNFCYFFVNLKNLIFEFSLTLFNVF